MDNENITFLSSSGDRLTRHMSSHCMLRDDRGDTPLALELFSFQLFYSTPSLCLHKREAQCVPVSHFASLCPHCFMLRTHLLEHELKLRSVQQELEQDLGLVFGVIEHLVFYLTQSFVVWIIGCEKKTT